MTLKIINRRVVETLFKFSVLFEEKEWQARMPKKLKKNTYGFWKSEVQKVRRSKYCAQEKWS